MTQEMVNNRNMTSVKSVLTHTKACLRGEHMKDGEIWWPGPDELRFWLSNCQDRAVDPDLNEDWQVIASELIADIHIYAAERGWVL